MRDYEISTREKIYRPYETILKWIVDIIMVVCTAYLLVIFMGSKTTLVGNSMSPTILDGDGILINKVSYAFHEPERFDVIIFEPKIANVSEYYIKRIIGLPGETFQIVDGYVYINGEKLEDPYFTEAIYNAGLATDAITLGYDEYFVLGDNRNNSEDSRFSNVGNIRKKEILGKIWMISSPISRIELIK